VGRLVEKETELVSSAIAYLRARGAIAWRNQSGRILGAYKGKPWAVKLGQPGLPDVFAVFGPPLRLLAVECKRAGGRLRPAQAQMLEQLRARGVHVVVAFDMRELEAALREI
jgi:hypothetical protein